MILQGSLYDILHLEMTETGEVTYRVRLNPDHVIYKAHFPGNPITPGACLVQMVAELAGWHLKKRVSVAGVSNVKFLNVIKPAETPEILVRFQSLKVESVKAVISDPAGQALVKISLSLTVKPSFCVIVPTYNNDRTLQEVLSRIRPYCSFGSFIFVVNDGSTDTTSEVLKNQPFPIHVISYEKNRGKGHALKVGFKAARAMGYDYAITIDSDGQHYPEDLPLFLKTMDDNQGALIVGQRSFDQENMPKGNTFANRFGNFWFTFQTWQRLADTQSGYRAYPLRHLHGLKILPSRYEAELLLLVMAAWHGIRLVPQPMRVYYAPNGERVSHFRPFADFARISVLNTILCALCFVYGWWSMLFHKLKNLF